MKKSSLLWWSVTTLVINAQQFRIALAEPRLACPVNHEDPRPAILPIL